MRNIHRIFLLATILPLLAPASSCTKKSSSQLREEMIQSQLIAQGITDPAIIAAFRAIPREEYVIPKFRERAYDDVEIPSGYGQSLDRASEDAMILKALDLKPESRVLEVGTGSGYLASLMSRIASQVFTIEIEPEIAQSSKERLQRLGFGNVHVMTGDGFFGWPEKSPFDAIILTCSPSEVPKKLVDQLVEGGRIVLPLGGTKHFQELILYRKEHGQLIEIKRISSTEFTPMKGEVLKKSD